MPQPDRPRKGSLGFSPRSRAADETPRFGSWPDDDGQPGLQGFAGYKAGMSHVVMINDEPDSPRQGMEETVPVTVLETPHVRVVALRAYEDTPYGARPLTEVWADDFHPELDRALDLPESHDADAAEEQIRDALTDGELADVRAITHTVPGDLTGVPKKRPDVMENRIGGGSLDDRVEFGLDRVGGEYTVTDVFRAGEYADVAASRKARVPRAPSSGGVSRSARANTPARAGAGASATSAPGTPRGSVRRSHSRVRPATTSAPNSTSA